MCAEWFSALSTLSSLIRLHLCCHVQTVYRVVTCIPAQQLEDDRLEHVEMGSDPVFEVQLGRVLSELPKLTSLSPGWKCYNLFQIAHTASKCCENSMPVALVEPMPAQCHLDLSDTAVYEEEIAQLAGALRFMSSLQQLSLSISLDSIVHGFVPVLHALHECGIASICRTLLLCSQAGVESVQLIRQVCCLPGLQHFVDWGVETRCNDKDSLAQLAICLSQVTHLHIGDKQGQADCRELFLHTVIGALTHLQSLKVDTLPACESLTSMLEDFSHLTRLDFTLVDTQPGSKFVVNALTLLVSLRELKLHMIWFFNSSVLCFLSQLQSSFFLGCLRSACVRFSRNASSWHHSACRSAVPVVAGFVHETGSLV